MSAVALATPYGTSHRFLRSPLGLDPGEEMINAARRLGSNTAVDDPIAYCVAGAEELGSVEQLGESSVDLLIAAMAVCSHTFEG